MEPTKQQQKSEELLQTIITKAWEDETFKQELIANPKETIVQVTGDSVKFPEGKTLVVEDQTDENTVFLNIPAEPNLEDMELNEEQLEAIAGGLQIMLATKHLHGLLPFYTNDL